MDLPTLIFDIILWKIILVHQRKFYFDFLCKLLL
jgi:hypothetical protein